MNRLFDLVYFEQAPRGGQAEAPLMTKNDWYLSRLCDASSGKSVWHDSAQEFCWATDAVNEGQVRLVMDVIAQNPEEEQMSCLMRVLQVCLQKNPSLYHVIGESRGMRIFRWLLWRHRPRIQQQAVDLLKMLWNHRSDIDVRVFLPLIIESLDCTNESPPFNSLLSYEAFGLLRVALHHYGRISAEHASEALRVLMIKWMSRADNTKFMNDFLPVAESLANSAKGKPVVDSYTVAATIFNATYASTLPSHLALCWTSAGMLAMMALSDEILFRDFISVWLPRVLALPYPRRPILQDHLRLDVFDQCRYHVMYAISEASKKVPTLLSTWARDLHELRTRDRTWAYHTILRPALERIKQVPPKSTPLPHYSAEEVRLLLLEHGFSHESAGKHPMTGAEFLQFSGREMMAYFDISPKERTIVEDIQAAYTYMLRMTLQDVCGFVSKYDMEWFLAPLRDSPNREYLCLIEKIECIDDDFYYLHDLVKRRGCLDSVTGVRRH